MCFTRTNLTSLLIAEKNIISYKILRVNLGTISSPFKKRCKWKDKKIRKAEIVSIDYVVYNGFHSFIEIKNALFYSRAMLNKYNLFLYKMIIPRGSKYYKNKTQYVSNQIKLASKIPIQSI